eukprot:10561305-Alexandrium_andersonii.AAC.1
MALGHPKRVRSCLVNHPDGALEQNGCVHRVGCSREAVRTALGKLSACSQEALGELFGSRV